MRIYRMNCPNCNGPLEYNPRQPLAFCQFCGAPLYFDDGTKRIEIKETKTYNYNETTRHEEVYENKTETEKWDRILGIVMFVGMLLFWFVLMFLIQFGK